MIAFKVGLYFGNEPETTLCDIFLKAFFYKACKDCNGSMKHPAKLFGIKFHCRSH